MASNCGEPRLAPELTNRFGRPMRILLLTETLCAGGAETFVVRLANALTGAGHEVMIAVMNGEMVHAGVAKKINSAVEVERLFIPAKRALQRVDRLLRALRVDLPVVHLLQRLSLGAIIRRWMPDVVHSHLVKADWLAADLKARTKAFRHVLTHHGEQIAYAKRTADPQMLHYDRRVRAIIEQADGIALISDQQEQHFYEAYGVSSARVTRILNGYEMPEGRTISSSPEHCMPEGKLIFGMVSRGIPDKGWGEAITAFQRLGREDIALVLVGEGPFFAGLSEPPPGVIVPGFSANPIEWICQFDVALLPTYYIGESLPTVIVEYLICGKPIIASDLGEIPKMMRAPGGELAGLLVPHSNRERLVKKLTEAMRLLADDPALRKRTGRLAIEAAQKFDMTTCVAQYVKLYQGKS